MTKLKFTSLVGHSSRRKRLVTKKRKKTAKSRSAGDFQLVQGIKPVMAGKRTRGTHLVYRVNPFVQGAGSVIDLAGADFAEVRKVRSLGFDEDARSMISDCIVLGHDSVKVERKLTRILRTVS